MRPSAKGAAQGCTLRQPKPAGQASKDDQKPVSANGSANGAETLSVLIPAHCILCHIYLKKL